eukprot:745721-Hanusia_phi.AAC.3
MAGRQRRVLHEGWLAVAITITMVRSEERSQDAWRGPERSAWGKPARSSMLYFHRQILTGDRDSCGRRCAVHCPLLAMSLRGGGTEERDELMPLSELKKQDQRERTVKPDQQEKYRLKVKDKKESEVKDKQGSKVKDKKESRVKGMKESKSGLSAGNEVEKPISKERSKSEKKVSSGRQDLHGSERREKTKRRDKEDKHKGAESKSKEDTTKEGAGGKPSKRECFPPLETGSSISTFALHPKAHFVAVPAHETLFAPDILMKVGYFSGDVDFFEIGEKEHDLITSILDVHETLRKDAIKKDKKLCVCTALAFSEDGRLLFRLQRTTSHWYESESFDTIWCRDVSFQFTGDDDGNVLKWDIQDKHPVWAMKFSDHINTLLLHPHHEQVRSCQSAVSYVSHPVAACCRLRRWDALNCKSWEGETGGVCANVPRRGYDFPGAGEGRGEVANRAPKRGGETLSTPGWLDLTGCSRSACGNGDFGTIL